MDIKVSRKEQRMQPSGMVEVLTSNVFDVYPIYSITDHDLITDVETIDDEREELLDREMFGAVKQRGSDPVDPTAGIQWAEAVLGEVGVPVIMLQLENSVRRGGPGVSIEFETVVSSTGKQFFQFRIQLSNAV